MNKKYLIALALLAAAGYLAYKNGIFSTNKTGKGGGVPGDGSNTNSDTGANTADPNAPVVVSSTPGYVAEVVSSTPGYVADRSGVLLTNTITPGANSSVQAQSVTGLGGI